MSDLIDRKQVLDAIREWADSEDCVPIAVGVRTAARMVESAPAVDAVEVEHAHWAVDEDPHDGDVRCSKCGIVQNELHEKNWNLLKALGYKSLGDFYRFCPRCGRKMDEVGE